MELFPLLTSTINDGMANDHGSVTYNGAAGATAQLH